MIGSQNVASNGLRLRLVKVSLAFILVALVFVGSRHGAFPIVNWPMYSNRVMPFPEASASMIEIRVTTRGGGTVKLGAESFLPFGRDSVIRDIIETAFLSEDPSVRARYQDALRAMVSRAVPGRRVAAIEVWRVVWKVDALASPPVDRSSPADQVLLGRLEPT